METRIKFTKRKLQSLEVPTDKLITYHDTETSGLKLSISKAGTYTFFIYRKIQGKPERIKIGNFPAITLEQAKKQAGKINALIADGKNPNAIKRADRKEFALGEFFQIYLDLHAKAHKMSWDVDDMNYQNHLKIWKTKKLSSITKKDVKSLHVKIGISHNHPYQANRVLSLLKIIFNKAIEWDYFHGKNPTNGIKKFKEKSRERFLQRDELQKFFEAVAMEENKVIRDYVLISLLTGARSINVKSMKWDEINFHTKKWFISKTKNDDPLEVPLSELAIIILKKIYETRKKHTKFVFPGNGKTGHLMEPKKGWERIKNRAEIQNLRMHDLRRTLGSWQANTGASLSIIGKSLGHKNLKTTEIYARINIEPVRESMKNATDEIMKAGKIKIEDFTK